MDTDERGSSGETAALPNSNENNEQKFICLPAVLSFPAHIFLGCILAGGSMCFLLSQSRNVTPIFDQLSRDLFSWAIFFFGLGILFFVARKMRTPVPRERSIVLNENELLVNHYSICSDVIHVPYKNITEIKKQYYLSGWHLTVKHSHQCLLADFPQQDAVDILFTELSRRAPATAQKINLSAWQFTLRSLFRITTVLALWLSFITLKQPLREYVLLMAIVGFSAYGIYAERRFIVPRSRAWRAFLLGFCLGVLVEGSGAMLWCLAPDWAASPYPFSMRWLAKLYANPTASADFGVLLAPATIGVFSLSGSIFGLIGIIIYRWRFRRTDAKGVT